MEVQKSSIQQSREYAVEPTHNFKFVKNLKNSDQQSQMLRNRIKILQINSQHKKKLLKNNLDKIQYLERVRRQTHKSQGHFDQLRKTRMLGIEEIKKNNQNFKQKINANYRANLQNIVLKKVQNYQQITKQSRFNQKKIEIIRNQNMQQRKMKHQAGVLAELKTKQKGKINSLVKTKTIHEQQEKQNLQLSKKWNKKIEQIKMLEKVEAEMLKKYSQNHHALKNVQNRLDEMLGKFQNQKNVINKKIQKKQQNYERSQSFYVLNKNKQ